MFIYKCPFPKKTCIFRKNVLYYIDEGVRKMFGRKKQEIQAEAPVGLADLHCHILAGVDDGARDDEQMFDLMKLEYDCGVRYLCFTPHYNPALFEPKPLEIAASFEKAKIFAAENLPDMQLFLGNEVFMRPDTIDRLRDHSCKPLGDSRVVLTEFHPTTSYADMRMYVVKLLSNGKLPLLAHIERYDNLNDMRDIEELKSLGVRFQINTEVFDSTRRKLIIRLVESGMIDVVADDRHSRHRGEPNLAVSYSFVAQRFGEAAAQALFIHRPLNILNISR